MANAIDSARSIREIALTAMFSRDDLLDMLALKGGNAIDIVHAIGNRASIDLDFSMNGDFHSDIRVLCAEFEQLLQRSFSDYGMDVFDVRFEPKPENVSPDLAHFWGGYRLQFKVIQKNIAADLGGDLEELRKHAVVVGPANRKTFEIDFSRYEHCGETVEHILHGYTVIAYSPRLIVAEKLRAICQQMPEYRKIVRSSTARPRARDFFDIHNLVNRFAIVTASINFAVLVDRVFEAKRVPRDLLLRIPETREYHRQDFAAVLETVATDVTPEPFDAYFDFVVERVQALKPFWNV